MSKSAKMDDALRQAIIQTPDVILDDQDVMQALIAANERSMGHNIVDLRGIAMERMETRMDRLQDTHRSVIAAAYENLAGTNQVHRAVLRLLEPTEFVPFLRLLHSDVADMLRVDAIKLVLEAEDARRDPVLDQLSDVLSVARPGYCTAYINQGRTGVPRQVTLRHVQSGSAFIYGAHADWIRSEACLKLDLGAGRAAGMMVLGTEDPHMFSPQHGTDLLAFFAGAFERAMRRWLS